MVSSQKNEVVGVFNCGKGGRSDWVGILLEKPAFFNEFSPKVDTIDL